MFARSDIYFRLHLLLIIITTTYISLSLRRTSTPIHLTSVLGVLGTQETFCIVIAGLIERDSFDLLLPEFDKPWVIHLRGTCYCSTNLCTWRPNNVYKNRRVRRHDGRGRPSMTARRRAAVAHAGAAGPPPHSDGVSLMGDSAPAASGSPVRGLRGARGDRQEVPTVAARSALHAPRGVRGALGGEPECRLPRRLPPPWLARNRVRVPVPPAPPVSPRLDAEIRRRIRNLPQVLREDRQHRNR
jgi:hypothetical protein